MDLPPHLMSRKMEFYKARGCQVQPTSNGLIVSVPSVCPMLRMGVCTIHKNKPQACKEYDCRQDPWLKGGKYNGINQK